MTGGNILRGAGVYIRTFLKIRTKDKKIVPLVLNQPQEMLYDAVKDQYRRRVPIRIIVLKARQEGMSTMTEALIFHRSATASNVSSMIVAHKEDSTANLFRMSKLFYDYLPGPVRPMLKNSNAQELNFENPTADPEEKKKNPGLRSRIRCATAGGGGVGRSDTLQNVHASEFAFWPGDKLETLIGLLQAVPDDPETLVVIESTANGFDQFKDLWDRAVEAWDRGEKDGWVPLFVPWWKMGEYRRRYDGFSLTEEENRLVAAYGLDTEQLSWRRWCIKTNCGGELDRFRQEYPASPDEAFLASGRCVFDQERLVLRRAEVKEAPWEYGSFVYDYNDARPPREKLQNIRWVADPKGLIRVHRQPEEGRPYVIGGDTAGTGSDKFTGQVLDNVTGEQVAVLQHQFDETMYARQMYCLGWFYGWALIGVETNYSTYPEKELERLGYPNLFVRRREDTFTGKSVAAFGFETTSTTRPLIIDGLKEVARAHLETIGDFETLGEMLSFVYNEDYRPEAEGGKHDDLVMALAIAHYIRPSQRREVKTHRGERARWTEDQWEDYRNATAEGKAYLLGTWGNPF